MVRMDRTARKNEIHPSMQRLYRAAADLRGDRIPADVARRLNVSAQRLNNWDARGISIEGATLAQKVFGCDANWLLHGIGQMVPTLPAANDEPNWDDITAYAQAVGLGNGAEAQEYADTHKLKFKTSSLRKRGIFGRSLAVYYGRGDSMEPTIKDGDAIMFDTSDTRPTDDALFVVQVGHEVYVKRAEVLDDVVYFRSDNPRGDHQWRKARRMDSKKDPITILGRVHWIGAWVD